MSGTLEELAAVIGLPGAKAMCSVWGGQRYYVPKQPNVGGALVALLGDLLADRLAARFGGDYVELPLPDVPAARRLEARRLRAEGLSFNEIAERLGLSRRSVSRLLAV